MDVEGIVRRLESALEKAQKQGNQDLVRVLLVIRDGALFGSKYDASRIIREHYLKKGMDNE